MRRAKRHLYTRRRTTADRLRSIERPSSRDRRNYAMRRTPSRPLKCIQDDSVRGQIEALCSNETFETLIDSSDDVIIIADPNTMKIQAVNQRVEGCLGFERATLLNQPLSQLFPDTVVQSLRQGESLLKSQAVHRNDASQHPVDISSSPVTWGERGAMLIRVKDLRREIEEHELHEQLQHLEPLAAVGGVVQAIIHDLNNILTSVIGNTSLLQAELQNNPHLSVLINDVLKGTERGVDLIRRLREFSDGPKKLELIKCNVKELVKSIISQNLSKLSSNFIIPRFRSGEGDFETLVDYTYLSNVIENLLLNARDALQYGGIIIINVDELKSKAGKFIRIVIEDNGTGIAEEDLPQVFKPFFTTKARDKGTGLGLAISKKIIKAHGGSINVESEEGEYTRFTICLPIK